MQELINFLNDLDGVHVDERNEIVHGVSLLREPIIERIAEDAYEDLPDFISDELGDGPACVVCAHPILTTSLCDWFICEQCNEHDGVVYGLKFPPNAGDKPGESANQSARSRLRANVRSAANNDDESFEQSEDQNDEDSENGIASTSSGANGGGRRRAAQRHGRSDGSKSTYFDAKLFMYYFEERLLPALAAARLENALIVLDLASIHLKLVGGLTLSQVLSAKQNGIKYLRERGEIVDASLLKPQIDELVRQRFAREQTDAQRVAAAAGHRVVYLPAHHPSLNLIEYVWSVAKRKLARLYCKERRFDELPGQAFEELVSIEKQKVLNMMEHVKREEHYYVQLEMQVLQSEDRTPLEAYRKLQRRYEERQAANGTEEDENIEPPTIPHTMPLSFRGDLNRFKQF